MNNTIRLLEGSENLTIKEYEKFSKGNTIFGADSDPKELKRWPISEKEEAIEELKKHHCEYDVRADMVFISEFALEFFEVDEDGEFISGSDFDLAEEI